MSLKLKTCQDCRKILIPSAYELPNTYIYCKQCASEYISGRKQMGTYHRELKKGVTVPDKFNATIDDVERMYEDIFWSSHSLKYKNKYLKLLRKYSKLGRKSKKWVDSIMYALYNFTDTNVCKWQDEYNDWCFYNEISVFDPYELSDNIDDYHITLS
jgi:hypothetical protein